MGSKFESILQCVKSRKRFLNALNGVWRLLTVSLILTAIYLIIEVAALPLSFKFLPKFGLSWLIFFNFVVGAVGFVIGYLQRIDLATALYHADRKLKLGEKLSTIYDLRAQAPTSDFLKMLYQRIDHLEINVKKLFPFSRAQKIKFASLAVLALFWAVLALQHAGHIHFIGLREEKEGGSLKTPVEPENMVGLMEQLAEVRESVEALERLQQQVAAKSEARNEALEQAAQLLAKQLDSLQQALLGQGHSTPAASTTSADRAKQRQKLEEDLQRLNEKLSQGASSDEIGELLKSIAQNISSESFEKLSEAAQAYDQDRLEELSKKLSNELEAQEKLDQQIQELQEKLKELVTALEKQKEQMASKEQGEPSEGPSDTKAEAPGHPEEGEAPKHEAEETGQEANTQGGKSGTPMPKKPSQTPPDFYNAPIRGLLPPTPTNTKELPTKKAPIETEVTAQGIVYRVNYEKLEAFLQEMQDELPPEMREIIRAYFQLITQQ